MHGDFAKWEANGGLALRFGARLAGGGINHWDGERRCARARARVRWAVVGRTASRLQSSGKAAASGGCARLSSPRSCFQPPPTHTKPPAARPQAASFGSGLSGSAGSGSLTFGLPTATGAAAVANPAYYKATEETREFEQVCTRECVFVNVCACGGRDRGDTRV